MGRSGRSRIQGPLRLSAEFLGAREKAGWAPILSFYPFVFTSLAKLRGPLPVEQGNEGRGPQMKARGCLVHFVKLCKDVKRAFEVLNEIYLQNFLHRWVVNRETNLMMLINPCLINNKRMVTVASLLQIMD